LKNTEDWRLLKAIDRVFWLRYIATEALTEEESEKLDVEFLKGKYESSNCPFLDPRDTTTKWGKMPENTKKPDDDCNLDY